MPRERRPASAALARDGRSTDSGGHSSGGSPVSLVAAQPGLVTPAAVRLLQRTVGNRAVGAIVQRGKRGRDIGTGGGGKKARGTTTDPQTDPERMDSAPAVEMAASQKFWARTVVRAPSLTDPLKAKDVRVDIVSISPERRATLFGAERGTSKQGAHLVAWSAMVRYWNKQLVGPLDQALARLEEWILGDQLVDTAKIGDNADKRARAYFLVRELLTKTFPIDTILNYYDEAVSLFVEANQMSSFATQGESHGGQAEADSLITLAAADDMAESGKGLADDVIKECAKNLYDMTYKRLDDQHISKVVHTWYTMLVESFPKIRGQIDRVVLGESVGPKTVQGWLKVWQDGFGAGRAGAATALAGNPAATVAPPGSRTTGVVVVATPLGTSPDKEQLAATQVNVDSVEIPARMRAETRFGASQQSHTLAWTYKRQALTAMLRNKTVDKLLDDLLGMAKDDRRSLVHTPAESALIGRADQLISFMERIRAATAPFAEWSKVLHSLLIEYIEINQALPSSTYSGADRATGHAEATANKRFAAAEVTVDNTQPDALPVLSNAAELARAAPRYVDMGAFYVPLVKDLTTFTDLSRAQRLGLHVGEEIPSDEDLARGDGGRALNARAAQMNRRVVKAPTPKPLQRTTSPPPPVPQLFASLVTATKLTTNQPDFANLSLADFRLLRALALQAKQQTERLIAVRGAAPDSRAEDFIRLTETDEAPRLTELLVSKAGETGKNEPLKALDNRLQNIAAYVQNYRSRNPEVRRYELGEIRAIGARLADPNAYVTSLVTSHGWLLEKVFGDFYFHLEHFSPEFRAALAADKALQTDFLHSALRDPLKESDNRIGSAIKTYFGDEVRYDGFMNPFRKAVGDYAATTLRQQIFGG